MKSILEDMREERKKLQAEGQLPEWFTTPAWQTVKRGYLNEGERGMRDVWERVSNAAARHLPLEYRDQAKSKFFNMFWKGWLAGATPVLTNMGTDRGCPVSCSGGYVSDQIGGDSGFYGALKEAAVLSKNGFGTSAYLGDIRPRGVVIKSGGHASGVLPVFKDFIIMASNVSQGGTRRGAFAGYLEIDHSDFWEISKHIAQFPDDANIGWCISKKFIERLDSGDTDAISRYQAVMKLRVLTGKGYFLKTDTANEASPKAYKDRGLVIKASNLCSEIMLPANEQYTFTCVLSSMNAYRYDEWKDTDSVFWATIFLDCVASEFLDFCKRNDLKDLHKAVAFTESSRALGLGCLGFHSYLQSKNIAIEELQAGFINNEIFSHIKANALKASRFLAKTIGEPEFMKGSGLRNSHLLAVAPNTSSALICGGISQGIEPIVANVWTQNSVAGEISRISPMLLKLLKEKGLYTTEIIKLIARDNGSVQNLKQLSDHERLVFKTAYEIDQKVLIRLASQRQAHICQAQSLNLFFPAEASEALISEVHKMALKDPRIKSLYYLRTLAGVIGSTGECIACEG